MKKTVVIFLTFIYLLVASGAAFNLHYCKGKISSISFALGQKHDGCCGKKKMTKKKCCKDKTAVLKINDTQYSSVTLKAPALTVISIDACFSQINFNLNPGFATQTISSPHAPPDIYQNPIYLHFRTLVI